MSKVYAYLRASTKEQDASRALQAVSAFALEQGVSIQSTTTENESGAKLERPKLMALLESMRSGDILLIEQVDRLTRLEAEDWKKLKTVISERGVNIVSMDLPTSHAALKSATSEGTDAFTASILTAVNGMILDILAATARKDYEDRRRRQAEGIAKTKHLYAGKPVDEKLHAKVIKALHSDHSLRDVAKLCDCSLSTVQRVLKLNPSIGDKRKQTTMTV